jgi:hypothetical protein
MGVVILGDIGTHHARIFDSGGPAMEQQTATSPRDRNRAIRDRLGHKRTARATVRLDAELNVAVNDLQDLARSRLAPHRGEPR